MTLAETTEAAKRVEEKNFDLEDVAVFCLNQIFKSKVHISPSGQGDCLKCTPNENNNNCKGYYPIKIKYFYTTT